MAADGGRVIELGVEVTDQPRLLADLARQCYPGMSVAVERAPAAWRLRLTPLAPLAAADDPDLASVLAARGLGLDDLTSWHQLGRVGGRLWLESMNHAWALLAWAEWFTATGTARPMIVRVAGPDLGVPALVCLSDPASFVGLMEDTVMDLRRPDTVAAAIAGGLVGTDSFLTPLLRARPADIVHLMAEPAAEDSEPLHFDVAAATPSDDRPPGHLVWRPDERGACRYHRVTSPSAMAELHRGDQPVLLDVDLSYFDLVQRRRRGFPEGARPASVEQVVRGVSPMAGSIAVVTVSLSAGLCPAARWDEILDELRLGLTPLLTPGASS